MTSVRIDVVGKFQQVTQREWNGIIEREFTMHDNFNRDLEVLFDGSCEQTLIMDQIEANFASP